MVVALDRVIGALDLWLHLLNKDQKPRVDPNLDPVLLVPGIGGSILTAVNEKGRQERVWVRLFAADHEFRTKLWSLFDPSTGQTVSLDKDTKIIVPDDNFGLYACDSLDPALIIGQEAVCYFHDMIEEMIKWGFEEGKTLFGFGYDFRQSNRFHETLDRFLDKLKLIYDCSGGKKVNIVSHSMGGLLVKCFMSLHSDVFEKYVKSWIAIAAPFQGAPGYTASSLLSGMSFVNGWEQNLFISKWSMHQLLIECPSMYELMACPHFKWSDTPLLQVWKEIVDDDGNISSKLESYRPSESISIMVDALSSNKIQYDGVEIPLPFNLDILKWSNETRKILSSAKVPPSVKFFNIYGICNDTPHNICYGSEKSPVSDLRQLLISEPNYVCVDGDGTVPAESASADGFCAEARIAVPADHRGIISDRHVFRILKHWLGAGEPDPYYNPMNDYVILPDASEFVQAMGGLVKEQWEIISDAGGGGEAKDVSFSLGLSLSSVADEFQAEEIVLRPNYEDNVDLGFKRLQVAVSTRA
ncbi:Lecithin-cholesterol acyltransferase-like 4 [Nymphaea thermarum]|nr:Lecithin-cholesterol acyltransferase-like 4 [Nymphaea thermarum]